MTDRRRAAIDILSAVWVPTAEAVRGRERRRHLPRDAAEEGPTTLNLIPTRRTAVIHLLWRAPESAGKVAVVAEAATGVGDGAPRAGGIPGMIVRMKVMAATMEVARRLSLRGKLPKRRLANTWPRKRRKRFRYGYVLFP